jgi:uroporphyrinogen-III synthase
MSRPLLVLRPEPGATRTVARARAIGLEASAYPLFAIAALAWEPPDPARFDAVLFTSANAARQGGPGLARYHALPAFAVGPATAAAVREAGWVSVAAGTDGVQSIARQIAALGHARVLHIAGEDVRTFDPGALSVRRVAVYTTEPTGDAASLIAKAMPGTILLLHSPRAAARLASLVPMGGRGDLHVVAISPAALASAGTGWASALAAATPDDNALLALAAALCDGSG